jgi:RecA/RadA recombinase
LFLYYLSAVRISTGSAALDNLLGGGIETKALTEIYGEYRCGKTQICLNLCVTSQINEKNPGRVVFIDTEGSFRTTRVAEIAERYELEKDDILENIAHARAFTFEQQIFLLEQAAAMMVKEPFRILIIVSFLLSSFFCFPLFLLISCFVFSAGFSDVSRPY